MMEWKVGPAETNDGREVVILEVDCPGDFPIVGRVKYSDGNWVLSCWRTDGAWSLDPKSGDSLKRPRIEGWVNVYLDRTDRHLYTAEWQATNAATSDVVRTIKLVEEE